QSYPYGLYESPNNYALNYDIMNTLSFTHNPNEKYNYDTRFSLYHNRSNSYVLPDDLSGDPFYTSISKINSTRLNFQTQHNYKITNWNTVSIGYNLETESIDGRSKDRDMWNGTILNSYSGSTLQNDVFINDSINIKDKLFIRGGARLTHHSDFGTYVSPNASAALVLPTFKLKGAKTKFRGSWGQSVNNPTLYQRFGTVNSAYMISLANPNLKNEKMESWELGITQTFFEDRLSFDLGYFNSDYKDYIGYHGSTDPLTWMYVGKYINVDEAKIQGVEGKITWEPKSWFKIVSSYTYTDSEDKTTKADLPSVPRNSFKTIAYWTPHKRIDVFAGVEANSGRSMSTAKNADRTDGYVDAKIGANIKIVDNETTTLSLKGVVYNLLDQDISMYKQGPTSYYAPGVNFRIGMFMDYTIPERKNKIKKENL
ncbi:MAG: TonB-dependent receptor, partial [Candidatus Gastranaerophilales bacterium]|nr:TonB-dependent receptor [Candidatus Gastranaerophilales bacterium]